MSFLAGQQRPHFVSTTVPCSKMFLRFLNETEGCELLTILEQSGRLLFHLADNILTIEHDPQVAAQQIITILQRKWQEVSMKKAVQVSLLHQQCTTSKSVQLTVPQAAVIQFHRSQIIRENKIVDILVDSTGLVSWFGQHDCVASAARHIIALMQEYFPKDSAQTPPEGYADAIPENSPMNLNNMDNFCFPNIPGLNSYGLSAFSSTQSSQIYSDEFMKNLAGALSLLQQQQQQTPAAAPSDTPSVNPMMSSHHADMGAQPEHTSALPQSAPRTSHSSSRPDKRRPGERIYFMVPSTDAPRLIGTRGVNKKRIEEQTGCSITLHTESKKDGEFPVEINGSSMALCDRAKLHIEKFLASNGNNEEKKERSRPKVHLEFSPKKTQPTNSSTPKKEYATDENGNW